MHRVTPGNNPGWRPHPPPAGADYLKAHNPGTNTVPGQHWISPGWQVTFAGTGINLALGVLYAWSVIAAYLRAEVGWSAMHTQLPYMVACGTFALLMMPAGRLQDRFGPRRVIVASGVLVGIGLVGSSFFLTVAGLSVFFGLFFGAAVGFGYSSTTPAAVKWFGAHKRGLVTGLVVSGSGLAAVYAAPLANALITGFGISQTFLIFGIAYFIIILVLAQIVRNPPEGYIPPAPEPPAPDALRPPAVRVPVRDRDWKEMVRDPRFYMLWAMFCFGALAGLMVIGQLASIAIDQSAASLGFVLVAVLAVFNAAGRIGGGMLFDRIGQTGTLLLIFSLQAVNFFLFNLYNGPVLLLFGTIIAGLAYGACLAVFPPTMASLFGVKNLGVNYGLLFTAWGAGGVFGGLASGLVRDITGSYLNAYLIAGGLCAAGAVLTLVLSASTKRRAAEEKEARPEVAVPA